MKKVVYVLNCLFYGLGIQLYFKHIYRNGIHRIPAEGRAWLNSNHSNAFLDAVVLGLSAHRRLWYLARSDVFRNPKVAAILHTIGILPIYRLEEGYQNLENNNKTFRICHDLLSKGDVITIYPEGNCIRESRLRPLKKGSARIAMGLFEYNGFKGNDLPALAVGINFDLPDSFSSEVHVRVSEPFSTASFYKNSENNKAKAILEFNEKLNEAFDRVHLNIVDPKAARVFFFIKRYFPSEILNRTQLVFESNAEEDFFKQKSLAVKLNKLFKENTAEALELRGLASELQARGIGERLLNYKGFLADKVLQFMGMMTAFVALLPFTLINYPVFITSYRIAKRKIKQVEFFTSINLGLGVLIGLIWYSLLFLVIYQGTDSISLSILAIPFSIACGLLVLDLWKAMRSNLRDIRNLRYLRQDNHYALIRAKADRIKEILGV